MRAGRAGSRLVTVLLLASLSSLLVNYTCTAGAPPGPESVFNDAGYIHVGGGRQLFYWLFESRHAPETDPLVIWFSGGPGCSSSLALFSENGPYHVVRDRRGQGVHLELNPYSWNNNATVVWLDQPAGTGFSVGVPVHNEDQVASHVLSFVHGLLDKYPHYAPLPFYLFGESYAGHYVPHIGARVVKENRHHRHGSRRHINLQGIAIGNGLVDPVVQFQYYHVYAHERQLVDGAQLALMRGLLPLCESLAVACNVQVPRNSSSARALEWTACLNAYIFCNMGELLPVQSTGVNVYDVRRQCDPDQRLCYDFSAIEQYLDEEEVQEALGVHSARKGGQWKDCNPLVDLALVYGGDWMKGYARDVGYVLEEGGVPVLVYAGTEDFICNWRGNYAWTGALRWSGAHHFNNARNETWVGSDGQVAGYVVSAHGHKPKARLSFVQVLGAGHLVPMDQPRSSLSLMQAFITQAPLPPHTQPHPHPQAQAQAGEIRASSEARRLRRL